MRKHIMTASTPSQLSQQASQHEDIIIIGASHAGIACAERLRKLGHEGSIRVIDRLKGWPLERPPLSKAFLKTDNDDETPFSLRAESWFADNQITLMDGVTVTRIAPHDHQLTLDNGDTLNWHQLVLATGAYPRPLPVPGGDNKTIMMLRHPDDARALRAKLNDAKHVIIIGGGYIGLEVAASARTLGKEVSVIEAADRLLARVASAEASAYFQALHQANGVVIHTQAQVNGITETENSMQVLIGDNKSNTKIMDAGLVIAGIGVIPDMELATKAGLATANGVMTDACYRSSVADIYAIGDVALPAHGYTNGTIRLESVHHAQMSADIAAQTMMGQAADAHETPWFWSEQYDVRLQSAGLVPTDHDTVQRQGRRDGQVSFWSFSEDGKLAAVEALNDGQAYMVGRHLLSSPDPDHMITKALIADPATDLKALMKRS